MEINHPIFIIQDTEDPLHLSQEAELILIDLQLIFANLIERCENQTNPINSSYMRVLRRYTQQICKLFSKLNSNLNNKILNFSNNNWIFELKGDLTQAEAFNWLYSSSIELKSICGLAIDNLFADINDEAYLGLLISFNSQICQLVYIIDKLALNSQHHNFIN